MARKDIGRVLSGGAVVLCIILFLTVDIGGQDATFKARKVTRTVSGTVGLGGVAMKGFPGEAVVTDENGNYTATVDYGWNGTVTPTKVGYTFVPASLSYTKVIENQVSQDYKANPITFTIAGATGIPGVEMAGLPGNLITGPGGSYSVKVAYGFSGTVTPNKPGYTFTPPSKPYSSVVSDQTNQNYVASPITYIISGTTGADGVVMKGLPGDPVTGADGTYKATVPYGWVGSVIPTKLGYKFDPPKIDYPEVTAAMSDQNYAGTLITFTVSGKVGVEGVVMNGLQGNPVTGADGSYSATVTYGWSGTVTPSKEGYTFVPQRKPYTAVTADQIQDYTATPITFTISGKTNVGGVVMEGLPGDPVTDVNGNYKVAVQYGWIGTVTPKKESYTFTPDSRPYQKVVIDQIDQNYTPSRIKFLISGSAGVSGVTMKGLPGDPLSGKDGTYSVTVEYGWNGKVTPTKEGYTFEPASRPYADLISAQPNQDYTATLLKRAITGKIESERGPVEGVSVTADGGGAATTDASGVYTLSVDYGWRGKVVPTKEGYTFKPPSKPYESVTQNQAAQNYTGEVRMLTISGKMAIEGTPLPGVKMTASNGGGSDTTDAEGKYKVKVPYGWSGDLTPTKEGFEFDPPSFPYTNVTQDMKDGATEKPPEQAKPPEKSATEPAVPEKQPAATGREKETGEVPDRVKTEPGAGQVDTEKALLAKQIEALQGKLDALLGAGRVPDGGLVTKQPGPVVGPLLPGTDRFGPTALSVLQGPPVTAVFVDTDLREVLREIASQAKVDIYVDDTVKATYVTCQLRQVPLEAALQTVLRGTSYVFKKIPNSYLVYAPINNVFVDEEIRNALKTIASQAKVVIIPDESVSGLITCELKDASLQMALEIVLAGTGFVVKRTPNYYLVGSPKPSDPAFAAVSETRRVEMNYVKGDRALALLSPAFRSYVLADANTVCVTAPPTILERIASDLKEIDRKPRHVLLEARIVVMERGNLLNMGIEWGWPKLSAGFFGQSSERVAGTEGAVLSLPAAWPWGVQMGYTSDKTFTDSLLLTLNLLKENSEADIVASPQVLAQDGKVAEIRVMTEEYYMLTPPMSAAGFYTQAQLEKVESGTLLHITPRIGDNNDITLEMAVEVSDSIPRGRGSDLPVVTRRTAKNAVRVQDGGTVALAGLTENRAKLTEKKVPWLGELPFVGKLFTNTETDKSSREIAVFVTAHLVPDNEKLAGRSTAEPSEQSAPTEQPVGEEFKQSLKASLSRQPR